jgi:hypothetical protein
MGYAHHKQKPPLNRKENLMAQIHLINSIYYRQRLLSRI